MDEEVLAAYLVKNALLCKEFRFHHVSPLRIFQFVVTAVGESHQVLVVLITAAAQRHIELAHVELAHQFLLHLLGHALVVDKSHGLAVPAAAHALGNFLKHAVVGVVVHLHLGILCKLKRI